MDFYVRIKNINALGVVDVAAIYSRLSSPGRNMRKELELRYIDPQPGPHESIAMALVWHNDVFVSWVGTRVVQARMGGRDVTAQTVECFTDPEMRKRGFAAIGLQALIAGGLIDRTKPVAVYRRSAVKLAERCGCKIVILCDPEV